MSEKPVVIEEIFNVSISILWKAITDKDEMKKWYFEFEDFKPEVGFQFQFYAGDEKKQWLHICEITEVFGEEKITYSWRYDGYPGISHVTFELFPEDDGNNTRLKLIHAGLENFPGHVVPELKKENFIEGWNQIIGISLKKYLENL